MQYIRILDDVWCGSDAGRHFYLALLQVKRLLLWAVLLHLTARHDYVRNYREQR